MKTAHIKDALIKEKFWWKTGALKRDENGKLAKASLEKNGFIKSNASFKRD